MGIEIKFRAWHEKFGMSLPFSPFKDAGIVMFPSTTDTYTLCGHIQNHTSSNAANLVWMQYTGLTDSEGVEICAGDIVRFTYWWFDGNVAESELIGEIAYDSACLSFVMKGIKNKDWLGHVGGDTDTTAFAFFNFDEADFRVVGNIYENPELPEQLQCAAA